MQRRSFIGGVIVALATAGCLGDDDDPDDSDPDNGESDEESLDGEYHEWATDAFLRPETSLAAHEFENILTIEEFADDIGDDDELLGADLRSLEYLFQAGEPPSIFGIQDRVICFRTDVPTEDILSGVEDELELPLEETAGYGRFDRWKVPDDEFDSDEHEILLGRDGDTFLFGTNREMFESAIDVNAGDQDGLAATEERFELAARTVGDPDGVYFRLDEDLESRAVGMGVNYASGESTATYAVVAADADAAADREESVQDIIEDFDVTVDRVDTDGRVITIEATVPTEQIVEDTLDEDIVDDLADWLRVEIGVDDEDEE